MAKPKKVSETTRKLNLIYEVLLHLAHKVLDKDELEDLANALVDIRDESYLEQASVLESGDKH